jgi:protein-S-isoprenylcysteine O-methyltransferase Ste14
MTRLHDWLFAVMWLTWAGYWWVAARSVKAAAQREPLWRRLLHIVPLVLGAVLLWLRKMPIPFLGERFLPPSAWPFWVGAVLTAAGLLFSVWARIHIGANWSGIVTIKKGHELVTSGPYAIVRHPIYTGLILAVAGSAIARAEWRGVLAVAIVFATLWVKLRFEERYMRQQFGVAYQDYSDRVSALIPLVL